MDVDADRSCCRGVAGDGVQVAEAVDPLVLEDRRRRSDGDRAVTAIHDESAPVSWLELAACRGKPIEWWYRTDELGQGVALAICRRCPVRRSCLADALDQESECAYRYGVRGGRTATQRAAL